MQERIEQDKKKQEKQKERDKKDPVMLNGKRMSELTTEEMLQAMTNPPANK